MVLQKHVTSPSCFSLLCCCSCLFCFRFGLMVCHVCCQGGFCVGLCACDVLLCVIVRVSGVVTTSARVLCFALLSPWDQQRAGPKCIAWHCWRSASRVVCCLPCPPWSADTALQRIETHCSRAVGHPVVDAAVHCWPVRDLG